MKRSLIALSLFMIIVPLVLALPPSVKNVYTLPQNPTLGNDLECTFNYTDTQNYVEQNNLRSSVKFLGFVNERDKPELLASAAIACFPSLGGESFGIVLIEAMAAGASVVLGGNNPGYTSVLGDRPESL